MNPYFLISIFPVTTCLFILFYDELYDKTNINEIGFENCTTVFLVL